MDDTVIIALISSGGSVLVGITALLLNYRGFASLDARMTSLDARVTSLESRFDAKITSLESRFDARFNLMQSDMRDLNKAMAALEVDVALMKDKAGI